VAYIDDLFKAVSPQGISDLLLLPGEVPLVRKGRAILKTEFGVVSAADAEQVIGEIMPEHNVKEFRIQHDTHFAYECPGVGRFRCSVFMDSKGWCGVFRLVPSEVRAFDTLGLPQAAKRLCYLRKGLVVVAGHAGSGRSTTLASLIDVINETRSVHVVTLEDPIEFAHKNKQSYVNQRSLREHTAGLAEGVFASVEGNPEVLAIGGIDDPDSALMALDAAQVGILVFAQMRTPDALSTVKRLLDCFPPGREERSREIVGANLKGVLAQCLCRRTDGKQAAAGELLLVTPSVAKTIREGRIDAIPETISRYKSAGMQPLNESLADLAAGGAISTEEAYVKAIDKDDLISRLKTRGIKVDADSILA
jgi:twitching motility protein PilT